jgi:hypothetical protein
MTKVFRKSRKEHLSNNKVRKYLAYALGEILLVMIGILLAFQVNNWNSQRLLTNAEKLSYANISRQILDDQSVIEDVVLYNSGYLEQFLFASEIIDKDQRLKADTLGHIALNLTKYSDLNRNSNIYQSLVNSGEIKLLKNLEIVERLQKLEESYLYINRMERIHFEVILAEIAPLLSDVMKYSDKSVQNVDKLYSYQFQNNFLLMISIMEEKDQVYHQAIREIDDLVQIIEDDLE